MSMLLHKLLVCKFPDREGVGKWEKGGMRVEYGGVGARGAGIGIWENTGR